MILGRLRAYVETESCSVLIVDAMKATKQLNKVYLETVDIDVILDALLEAKNRRSQSFFKRFLSYFVLFIAISAISGSNHWNQMSDSLHQVWQNNIAPFISGGYKQCAVALPDFFEDVLRPPINCSFCIGLESIDVVSNLSIETFEKEYAYTGRPVVVTNDQSIRQSASFSFELFKNLSKAHRLKSCQYFPYKTEFDTLEEALNMDEGRSNLRPGYVPWYIGWSICELKYINRLKNYVAIPSFLSPESDIKQTLWIFMGTPGHGAPMHIDKVGYPSWQTQLRGSKKWTLRTPLECFFKCKKHYEIEMESGFIIILDTNIWYHKTETVGDDISITVGGEYN